MKRVVFWVKRKPALPHGFVFFLRMIVHGIRPVFMCKEIEKPVYKEKDLYLSDDPERIRILEKDFGGAVAIAYTEEDISKFPDAKYILMEPFFAEASYFRQVYLRIKNIPWEPVVTKKLILRETTEADIEPLCELYKAPEMTKYTEVTFQNPEDEKNYLKEYIERVYKVQGFGIWTVVRKKDKAVLGRAGIVARADADGYEIGFAIGVPYQKQGYGKEAVKGIISYAKRNNLSPLAAFITEDNTASMALARSLDFVKGGEVTLNGICYRVWTLK